MTLEQTMTALVTLEEQALAGQLNVYRWWQPNIVLPAVWHWLSPGDTRTPDTCSVQDLVRIDVTIGVDPRVHAGHDMVALERAMETVRVALDAELYSRRPLGLQHARRLGMRTQIEDIAGLGVLSIVLPIEARLEHTHQP